MATLLLNADFGMLGINPLSVISWHNAIKLHFTGAAVIVEEYDNWSVSSPSLEMAVPSVMALSNYAKFSRAVKLSSRNIFIRDRHICQYCTEEFEPKDLTRDHVKPRKHGGKSTWLNLTTACKKCNHVRGHDENIRPFKMPWKPTIYEIESRMLSYPVVAQHETWIPYLEMRWEPELIVKGY
jgi:5-methylcytosine-specific restriction endonuclease McrA